MKKAVVALGGNAIIKPGEDGTISQQFANTRDNLEGIINLVKEGYGLAITHGNGPQVGNLLLAVEAISEKVAPLPLGVLVAATQGTMGYMIEQSLQNRLKAEKIEKEAVAILSQLVVDKEDPAIKNPTKPVGPFYTKEEAEKIVNERGWVMVEDAGRGFRRVVPSPKPTEVVERSTIEKAIDEGKIVITCGGGGIPVYFDDNGDIEGLDAVIDKDFASAVLAENIGAELLIISTGVDKVAINFGKENEKLLDKITVEEAKQYYEEGHFPKGSMGPKVLAAIEFLENGGKEVIITSANLVAEAVTGSAGTKIVK